MESVKEEKVFGRGKTPGGCLLVAPELDLEKVRIMVKKILGQLNPADLMTKYLSGGKTISDMEKLGFAAQEGRTSTVDGFV